MSEEITAILWSSSIGLYLTIGFFISAGFLAVLNLILLLVECKTKKTMLRTRIIAFGGFAVMTILISGLGWTMDAANAEQKSEQIIALAKVPPNERMIQVLSDGTVVISKRASTTTPNGQLVSFERDNIAIRGDLFPEVWRLAGGNADRSLP